MGSSCFARGNNENLKIIEDFVKKNDLNAKVDLIGSRCEDKCALAPTIIVNGTEYNNVIHENLNNILGNLKNE